MVTGVEGKNESGDSFCCTELFFFGSISKAVGIHTAESLLKAVRVGA
jgi:hypothetical protein